MAAHQCPRCPLRFSFRAEMEWHLAADHAAVDRPAERTSADDDTATTAPRTEQVPAAARAPTAR